MGPPELRERTAPEHLRALRDATDKWDETTAKSKADVIPYSKQAADRVGDRLAAARGGGEVGEDLGCGGHQPARFTVDEAELELDEDFLRRIREV